MRWVKRIALALVAIVVLLLGIGLVLPSTFNVQRSVDASATPDSLPADSRPARMGRQVAPDFEWAEKLEGDRRADVAGRAAAREGR
jgi:hypothetical protein